MLVWLIVGIGIGIMLLVVGGIWHRVFKNTIISKHYTGKEVFETAAEYGKFKRAIGSDAVLSYNADVLSSEPPIVVQFTAMVRAEGSLGYGKENLRTKAESAIHFWIPGSVLVISFGVMLIANLLGIIV